jgi:hypothetical protein
MGRNMICNKISWKEYIEQMKNDIPKTIVQTDDDNYPYGFMIDDVIYIPSSPKPIWENGKVIN